MSFQVNWSSVISYTDVNVRKEVKDNSGIYRLSYQNKDKLTIFYVGESATLQTRLLEHLSTNEANDCIKQKINNNDCYFRFAYVSGESNRKCAERYMYDKINPQCNKKVPDTNPCEINLDQG